LSRIRRPGLLLVALLVGCAGRREAALDASLPDGPAVEAVAPAAALDAFAANADPHLRATALAALVRELPWPEVERWVVQGTYDPDPWVQEHVADALAARTEPEAVAARVELALRGSADPYVRARVAHALIDAGHGAALEPFRTDPDRTGWARRADWRAAPLALVAARLGDPGAREVVERAVAGGDIRDDATFVVDLGRFGWPSLVDALREAETQAEDETRSRLALARAMLGDPAGRAAWAASLRDRDPFVQREALDLVRAMPPAVAGPWLKQLATSPDPGVRLAVAVLRAPSVATISRGLAAKDPYARAIAARAAAALPPVDAEPLLRRAVADADPEVRVAAAHAVADLRLVALDDALQPLTVDDRSRVRVAGQAARWRLERGAR
jgi:HEAT repeat protein